LKTLKSPGIEKAFSRALEKPLKIIKMSKILEKSLNLYILFVDLSLYDTVVIQIWQCTGIPVICGKLFLIVLEFKDKLCGKNGRLCGKMCGIAQ